MTPEQFEELKRLLKNTIHEEVVAIITDKFDTAFRKLDDLGEDVNSGFVDVAEDRKDFAIMKTNQATIERLMRETMDIVSNQTHRMAKTVEHKADQAIENSAQAVADQVEPIMTAILQKVKKGVQLEKKPRWKFWKR